MGNIPLDVYERFNHLALKVTERICLLEKAGIVLKELPWQVDLLNNHAKAMRDVPATILALTQCITELQKIPGQLCVLEKSLKVLKDTPYKIELLQESLVELKKLPLAIACLKADIVKIKDSVSSIDSCNISIGTIARQLEEFKATAAQESLHVKALEKRIVLLEPLVDTFNLYKIQIQSAHLAIEQLQALRARIDSLEAFLERAQQRITNMEKPQQQSQAAMTPTAFIAVYNRLLSRIDDLELRLKKKGL